MSGKFEIPINEIDTDKNRYNFSFSLVKIIYFVSIKLWLGFD